jgi:hypothetical protein
MEQAFALIPGKFFSFIYRINTGLFKTIGSKELVRNVNTQEPGILNQKFQM